MKKLTVMISPEEALKGRDECMPVTNSHHVLGTPLQGNFADKYSSIVFGLGCFWGAEKLFWSQQGVYTTAVGYAGGFTPNPTYEEVCSGLTGHTEVVLVVHDPEIVSLDMLLSIFWQGHDPTQGMRQGNDIGTQYRSAIYVNSSGDYDKAISSKQKYQELLNHSGFPDISTEIKIDKTFYYAEDYHQQYLGKNPTGYCGLRGTGVDY
jgi:peptide-methionine (S)-S-oxide reductase